MDAIDSPSPHVSPPRYFPLDRGLYEVAPGLRTLGTDFGNGAMDARVFQIDRDVGKYLANKRAARAENLAKYVCTAEYPAVVQTAVHRFLIKQLTAEYPDLFTYEAGTRTLTARLTGEGLTFDAEFLRMIAVTPGPAGGPTPPYRDAFDALTAQIPEDVAVIVRRESRDWLGALSLCSPSHWAAADKIGRDFFSVHAPVPGIERVNRAAAHFVDAMITKGPYVRFVWGFASDERLNHHPEPAPGFLASGSSADEWRGRAFRAGAASPFSLRVERQVTWGLPEVDAALFTIRVSFVPGEEIRARPAERAWLRSALLSMSAESLRYKGLERDRDAIVAWLDAGA